MNELIDYWYRWGNVWRFAHLYGWSQLGSCRYVVHQCGQVVFNSLAFFLSKQRDTIFLDAFDTDPKQAATLAKYYHFRSVSFWVQQGIARLDTDTQKKLRTQFINENFNSGRCPAEFYESSSPASRADESPSGDVEARSYGAAR